MLEWHLPMWIILHALTGNYFIMEYPKSQQGVLKQLITVPIEIIGHGIPHRVFKEH